MLIIRIAVLTLLLTVMHIVEAPVSAPAAAMDQAAVSVVHTKRIVRFSPSRSRAYAKTLVNKRQFKCLNNIWTRESHWNHKADNPTSSAYGIPQILKMKEQNPYKQIDRGMKYIEHRYGTPCNAWEFWQRNNWY